MYYDIIASLVIVIGSMLSVYPQLYTNNLEIIKLQNLTAASVYSFIIAKPAIMVPMYFGLAGSFSWVCWSFWHMPISAIVGMFVNVCYLYHIRRLHEKLTPSQL